MSFLVLPRLTGRALATAFCLTTLLAACGGGGGSGGTVPSSRVGGTAAVGAPIVGGDITLRCGNSTVYTTTTGSTGLWERVIPTAELPCVVRVSGGTLGALAGAPANAQTFYSLTSGTSGTVTVNISPLTSLALARAHAATLDEAWFSGLSDTGRQALAAGLRDAITALATALQGYALPDSFNPFDVPFTAGGDDPYDAVLEQLQQALAAGDTSFEAQLARFAAGESLPPVADTETPGEGEPGGGGQTGGDGPNFESLPDTSLDDGVYGVRLATAGTVNGSVQDGLIRLWTGPGQFDIGSTAGVLGEVSLSNSDFSFFDVRRLPNAVGTYACGDSLSLPDNRNIVVAYGVGLGYSSVGTGALNGFGCSITVTQVGTVSGGQYVGAIEGHFQARLFKTGAPVNPATTVLVKGHFRLGAH